MHVMRCARHCRCLCVWHTYIVVSKRCARSRMFTYVMPSSHVMPCVFHGYIMLVLPGCAVHTRMHACKPQTRSVFALSDQFDVLSFLPARWRANGGLQCPVEVSPRGSQATIRPSALSTSAAPLAEGWSLAGGRPSEVRGPEPSPSRAERGQAHRARAPSALSSGSSKRAALDISEADRSTSGICA